MNPPTLEQRLDLRKRPDRRPVMFQTWRELLFLHWRYDAALIQQTLPAGLYVDTFDDAAWVGVVPFFMRNIRPTWFCSVPGISHFLELNLRTYVHDERGRSGVWFYSLDANQPVAVHTARRFFRLPYRHARMQAIVTPQTGHVTYRSLRRGQPLPAESRFEYEPVGPVRLAEPGTLEFFLVERYVLFAHLGDGRLASGQVHHVPYPIQDAKVVEWDSQIIDLAGLPKPERPPDHALVSRGVDVEVFGLERMRDER
ncbi:MAG: YqjF family protein [Maioricimonas sp. JB049]